MPKYYAVERTDNYLAHYGVKGMKWGVQRAIKNKNKKALLRQYYKASDKLTKLKKQENIGNNKADAANYSKKAKRALGIGLAGISAATGAQIGRAHFLGKANEAQKAQQSIHDAYFDIVRPININKIKVDPIDPTRVYPKETDELVRKSQELEDIALKNQNKAGTAKRIRNIAGAVGVAGLGTAAVYGAKAAKAKYRATAKGQKEATAKRKQWEKEMRKAFKGTEYASLPDTGPLIYNERKEYYDKKAKRIAKKSNRYWRQKHD